MKCTLIIGPNHRLRGSASAMLTATHHTYGSLAYFLTFPPQPYRGHPSTDFHAKWLNQRGTWIQTRNNDVPFAVKIATFHTTWSPGPLKGQNFTNFWTEILRSIWPLTLEIQRENTPYSSSELNESDIVNTQSGGEKLKHILKFYIGGTCHVISRMRFGAEYLGNR